MSDQYGITISTISKTPFGVPSITITRAGWADIEADFEYLGLDPTKVKAAAVYLEAGEVTEGAVQQNKAVSNVRTLNRPESAAPVVDTGDAEKAADSPAPAPAKAGRDKWDRPDGPAPMCEHGERQWFSRRPGDPSGKKPFRAWMCAAPQGAPGKCDPIWVR